MTQTDHLEYNSLAGFWLESFSVPANVDCAAFRRQSGTDLPQLE